jgi:hypothetical protein
VIDPKLRNWIISTVTVVWALNFLVGIIPAFHYKPDQAINAIFMAIVGGLFAISARKSDTDKKELPKKKRDEEKDDEDGDEP